MKKCLNHLQAKFEMTISKVDTFVGLQIEKHGDRVSILQEDYIMKLLQRFEMAESKYVSLTMNRNMKYDANRSQD